MTEDEVFAVMTAARRQTDGTVGMEPRSLAEALPRRTFLVPGAGGRSTAVRFSDLLVVGSIVEVAPGAGKVYVDDAAHADEVVDVAFDDPRAHARVFTVTVAVDHAVTATGEVQGTGTLTFQMGAAADLLDAAGWDGYLAGISDLGRVVVPLKRRRDGAVLRPILQGTLICLVDDDGDIRCPGLGEASARFVGELASVDALLEAALAPPTSEPAEMRWGGSGATL